MAALQVSIIVWPHECVDYCLHPNLFLQAGITNGDYEAAGFSGQLSVVTLDTYNESEGQTGANPTTVVVLSVIIAMLVGAIFLVVVLLW